MKPTYTTQNVLRMILDDLRGSQSHMFSDDFIIFSVFSGCSPKKKHLKVPEFCRSDFGPLQRVRPRNGILCLVVVVVLVVVVPLIGLSS